MNLREQLGGAWKLESYVEVPVDGSEPFYPLGKMRLVSSCIPQMVICLHS